MRSPKENRKNVINLICRAESEFQWIAKIPETDMKDFKK